MKSGIHGPNLTWQLERGGLHDQVITAGKFTAAKLMHIDSCRHTVQDARILQSMDCEVLVRIGDSHERDDTILSSLSYADKCFKIILQFYNEAGVTLFQIDNEPNWTWLGNGYGPMQYQWWMKRAMKRLFSLIPMNVVLVAPPLSFAPAMWTLDASRQRNPSDYVLDDWLAAYSWTDAGRGVSLWRTFSRASANVYFENERQMINPSFGAMYDAIHQKSGGMNVVITEYANSMNVKRNPDGTLAHTPQEVEAARIAQYPVFLRMLEQSPYVDSAFLYIAPGSTPDWRSYELTAGEAEAVSHYNRKYYK